MKSNFYGNRKSLLAVFICAAFLSGSHVQFFFSEIGLFAPRQITTRVSLSGTMENKRSPIPYQNPYHLW